MDDAVSPYADVFLFEVHKKYQNMAKDYHPLLRVKLPPVKG